MTYVDRNLPTLVWGFVLVALFVSAGCPVTNSPTPEPTPVITPDERPAFADHVHGIEPVSDERLAVYFADFADVIERDREVIETTGDIRECNSRAGRLAFQNTELSHPGLAEEVDAALAAVLGEHDVPLTEERRRDAVLILEALSWACR